MPELPEVETVVRTLRPRLQGRTIVAATGVGFQLAPVVGQTIRDVTRHGKYVILRFDSGMLLVHLRMTGKLLFDGARTPYTRAEFVLDSGILLYDDIRRFGRITWAGTYPAQGPDPLEVSFAEFAGLFQGRRSRVKPLLLDQKFLRGLGNIYVDEALFRARVHPLSLGGSLGKARLGRLYAAIREVLTEAIALGGSSVSDYVDGNGERGSFQEFHRVYRRTGLPCTVCGAAIRRTVVWQRGTHFCPRCQRI
jgi:formamidopyrimidine-DNA glycosylase